MFVLWSPCFLGDVEPVVHPKGHLMARIEDLFFRSAVVREGAVVGDSQALEAGAEIPEGTQERVPDVLCSFAGLHHPSGPCQQLLLPTGETVPSAKLLLLQLCFVTAALLLLLGGALGILGVGVHRAW